MSSKGQPKGVNKYDSKKRELEIISFIVEGRERDFIVDFLMQVYDLTLRTSEVYYWRAKKNLNDRKMESADALIATHMIRYERMYERLTELNWHALAMKVLKAKEKLVGLDKQREVKYKGNAPTAILDESQQFDAQAKLSSKNFEKLNNLLDRVKKKKK